MHEVGIIQAVMDEITKAAEDHNITKINKVKLVVGKMNGALPDALEMAFEILTPGTMFDGASLEIERRDVVLQCPKCGAESTVKDITFFCPECDARAKIVAGRELYIDYFEGDEEGEGDTGEGSDGAEDFARQSAGGA
ncbi:MAG: hydrogenase maturation nickel metallochaperone HypA [Peptococcaceae bacterium]|nr:hydrogenase maturation nickel metallochaperone HypA [Peptococcaceae bacterium]